jgi:hypothetical protein
LLLGILLIYLKNIKRKEMKKLLNWISGFFSSESGTSSKRLVGIVGAFMLYWTLYENSKSEAHIVPADSLVWGVVALVMVALGLTTIESVSTLVQKFKGTKTEENGSE